MPTKTINLSDLRHMEEAARELGEIGGLVGADPRSGATTRSLFTMAAELYSLALKRLEGDLTLAGIKSAMSRSKTCDHLLGQLVDGGRLVRLSTMRDGYSLTHFTHCPDCGARLEGEAQGRVRPG